MDLMPDGQLLDVRAALAGGGFTEPGVLHALGVEAMPNWRRRRRDLDLHLTRTGGGSLIEDLTRLFLLHQPVAADAFAGKLDLDRLEQAGLIRRENGQLVANLDLLPFRGLVLASDLPGRGPDEVMGVAASTLALRRFMITRPIASALDLGSGCGVLALLAGEFAEKVTAVDVNARSVTIAELNARLNGVANIEYGQGDLFEPVKGRKFDLIVCNPPFVVGPTVSPVHTSAGEGGDHFCERVLREAPAYLNDGGFAQVLCNWVERDGETGRERMSRWLDRSGCDAWVLVSHGEPASEYSLARAKEAVDDESDIPALSGGWLEYLDSAGIRAVNFGVATLRKRAGGAAWFRYTQMPPVEGPCGGSVQLGFELRDFLESRRSDADMLKSKMIASPDLEITDAGRGRSRVSLTAGLRFSMTLDRQAADYLKICDGTETLKAQLKKLAATAKVADVTPSFLRVVRPLVEFGFLRPISGKVALL